MMKQNAFTSGPQDRYTPYQLPSGAEAPDAPPSLAGVQKTGLAVALCVIVASAMLATGLATYLFMKSDLIAVSSREKDALELQYQDRIERLRTEIERLNSRQMVDRESVELKVLEIVRRQEAITRQHDMVADLMDRAERSGIRIAARSPVPQQKPAASPLPEVSQSSDPLLAIGGESEPLVDPLEILGLRGSNPGPVSAPSDHTQEKNRPGTDKQATLNAVQNALSDMDKNSIAALDALALAAEKQIETIVTSMRPLGLRLPAALDAASLGTGGPFIPYVGTSFEDRVQRARLAMSALSDLKDAAGRLPIHRPVRHVSISSEFGPRLDPFLNRWAMHSGIDFRAAYGTRVYASAPGTVVKAGWQGGYGIMVEIRHPNGYVTRYAHLSRLQVKKGNHVLAGDVIGNIGSTGRSTGPHLHYEVRQNDKPIDPEDYIWAGDRLAGLLRAR